MNPDDTMQKEISQSPKAHTVDATCETPRDARPPGAGGGVEAAGARAGGGFVPGCGISELQDETF